MKVTLTDETPALAGTVAGAVKANVPPTEPTPPDRVDADKGWPKTIAVADGSVVIVGVALLTATLMLPDVVL